MVWYSCNSMKIKGFQTNNHAALTHKNLLGLKKFRDWQWLGTVELEAPYLNSSGLILQYMHLCDLNTSVLSYKGGCSKGPKPSGLTF